MSFVSVDGAFDQIPDVRHGADVVFVAVGQEQRRHGTYLVGDRPHVRDDQVDAEMLRPGEHHAGIHEQVGRTATDGHHVHAELADAAEEQDLDGRRTPGVAGHVRSLGGGDAARATRQRPGRDRLAGRGQGVWPGG